MAVTTRRRITGWLMAALVFAAAMGSWAGIAAAAPTEPTMGLTALQAKLDAEPDGIVDGYFKTVVKGSTIVTLPCEILAITSDDMAAPNPQMGLILFRATGSTIQSYGGIVAGMSGSPIYVSDSTTDCVVGALSYGDIFTKDGTGLATPIDAMSALEDYLTATSVLSLPKPVAVGNRLITDIVVTPDSRLAAGAKRSAGTLVAKPLTALSIGGISPSAPGYKKFADHVRTKGYDVLPITGPLGMSKDSFSAPFQPGSSVAAMIVRGDFWAGGIGTVTYVNGANVVAFGHPMNWDGTSGYGLSNAWIDGIWPSSISPYKLGRPGASRGTIVQDRGAGIVGIDGNAPAETTITADVRDAGTGKSYMGTSYSPRALMNSTDWGAIAPFAVYAAALRACDDYWYVGSAVTTTTIVVRDSVTSEQFTITRPNVWDSDWDVPSAFPQDPYSMVSELEWAGTNGVAHPDILSVDVKAETTPARKNATIVDVEAPKGLRYGPNPVRVSLLDYGVAATRTVNATVTIPAGTSLDGVMFASSANAFFDGSEGGGTGVVDRRTTAQVVADLQSVGSNDQLTIEYQPFMDGSGPGRSAATTSGTGTYLNGYVEKYTSTMRVAVAPPVTTYNGGVLAMGELSGVSSDATVELYARTIGQTTESLLGTVPAVYDETEGVALFEAELTGFKKNTVITAVFAGNDDVLGSRAATSFKVRAYIGLASTASSVKLGTPITLTASVVPTDSAGAVVFEVYRNGAWQQLATRSLAGAKATVTYRPPVGTWSFRARFLGNTYNAGQVSRTAVVKVTR